MFGMCKHNTKRCKHKHFSVDEFCEKSWFFIYIPCRRGNIQFIWLPILWIICLQIFFFFWTVYRCRFSTLLFIFLFLICLFIHILLLLLLHRCIFAISLFLKSKLILWVCMRLYLFLFSKCSLHQKQWRTNI